MFNITIVSKVSEHKHLGLILESDLSIDKHLNKKIEQNRTSEPLKYQRTTNTIATLVVKY